MKLTLSEVNVTTEQRYQLGEAVAVQFPTGPDRLAGTRFLVADFIVITEVRMGGGAKTRYRFYGKGLRRDGKPKAEMNHHVDIDGSLNGSYDLLRPFLKAVARYAEGL